MQKFNLKDFSDNGVSWPFNLDTLLYSKQLEEEYFKFQEKAIKFIGSKVTLKPNLLCPFFYNLSVHPSIVNKVKSIIGDDIYIWSSAFFPKAPNEGKMVSFHQDNPYWQLSSKNVISVWIALTESKEESGALQVVPKSSHLGLINKLDVKDARNAYLKGEKTTNENDLLSYNQNLDKFIKKNPPMVVNLEAGQFSIHHVNTVHGSAINKTKKHRIGYVIRYISTDTKHLKMKKDSAIHVNGKTSDYYYHEKKPLVAFSNAAIEEYNKAMKSAGAFGNKAYA